MLEDEHFCSLLCDQGFIVHIIDYHYNSPMKEILRDIISWRCKVSRTTPKNIAIIAQELSIPKVLHFLTDTAYPTSSQGIDIGAVVLIDPPPLNSLITPQGRLQTLNRYFEPYYSVEKFRNRFSSDTHSDVSLPIRWERFRRQLNADDALSQMLIDSEDRYSGAIVRNFDEHYDIDDYSVLASNTALVIASQLLGKAPTRVSDIAKALKDRILVVNSFEASAEQVAENVDISEETDEDNIWSIIGSSFGKEDWGYECAESVADMYQAGPVIHLESCLYPSTGQSEYHQLPYEVRVREWHQELADTMSDWLRLLHQMRYI